jgi:hypothetical protein
MVHATHSVADGDFVVFGNQILDRGLDIWEGDVEADTFQVSTTDIPIPLWAFDIDIMILPDILVSGFPSPSLNPGLDRRFREICCVG